MKLLNVLSTLLLALCTSIHLTAQYVPGHHAVELNASKSGISILNSNSSSTSNLSLYSDASAVLDLGIGNSTNLAIGPDIAYIFTDSGTPLDFNIGGFRRMFITADGKVGINSPTSFLERFYVNGDSKFIEGTMKLEYNSDSPLIVNGQDSAAIKAFGDSRPAIYARAKTEEGAIHGVGKDGTIGVYGTSETGTGVHGQSDEGVGVDGASNNFIAVRGFSGDGTGVYGSSNSNFGVYGATASLLWPAIKGDGDIGIWGAGISQAGVLGTSSDGNAVVGRSDDANKYDFYADGAGMDYGSSSSRRWKKNITTISQALAKIKMLRGVYFDWDEAHGGKHDIGFIAEEIGSVLPEIVSYEDNGIDAIAVDYSKVTPLLLQAIIELSKEIEKLKVDCASHH